MERPSSVTNSVLLLAIIAVAIDHANYYIHMLSAHSQNWLHV